MSTHYMLILMNVILFEKKPGIGTGVVMVGVLASNAVDRGFELRYVETKDYIISMCCFSAKPTPLRSNMKYWLARNQDYVSG
jgi:hypothetical protein